MRAARPPRPGTGARRAPDLRREGAVLVPVSLLLLVALAVFTLISYRTSVRLLVEERREEALVAARVLAARLAAAPAGGADRGPAAAERLADALAAMPGVATARVLDADGRELAVAGELPGAVDPLAPFGDDTDAALAAAGVDGVAVGPGGELPGTVAALVPVRLAREPAEARYLRLDLPAALLGAQQRALAALSFLVLGVGLAVGTVMLLFLRRLLGPYDRMVARAREVAGRHGDAGTGDGDDIELLVRTFERGMAALARGEGEGGPRGSEARGGTEVLGGTEARGDSEALGDADARGGADADIAALERTLAGSVESGLLLLDAEGRVLALNPVGAELLGVPPPAAGEPLATALAAAPELAAVLEDAVRGRHRVQRREVTLAPRNGPAAGRTVPLGLTVHPLRRAEADPDAAPHPDVAPHPGAEPAVRGFLVLFADLTEARRQAEEERLADSLARLGELAAGVAHEMRNGLATLRGYLRLAERSPDDAAELLGEMHHEADHLQRVVEDFLAFARPGSVRLEEVPLGPLLARAAADPALGGAAVRVEDGGLGALRVLGDAQLLERAVRNLVHNAVQAQAQGRSQSQLPEVATDRAGQDASLQDQAPAAAEPVVLRLARDAGGALEIRVEDRGPGVSPELRERLFHPFATGRAEGVGLGLALTQRIVSLHGAAVRLDERPGGGTAAVIRVPRDRIVTKGNSTPPADGPSPASPYLP